MKRKKKVSKQKDSLVNIVNIMEFTERNFQQADEELIIDEFGEEAFKKFSRYCLGDNNPYAAQRAAGWIELNQSGLRHLYELRKILAEERRANQMKMANMLIAIASCIMGITAYTNIYPKELDSFSIRVVLSMLLGVLLFYSVCFVFKTLIDEATKK